MYRYILLALIVCPFILSCSKYGHVTLNYPLAPQIILPPDIESIAVVNRSLSPKQSKNTTTIEAVTTGEVAGSDYIAADEALKAVCDKLNGSSRLSALVPARSRLVGTGTRVTPELLNWSQVKNICDSAHVNALLVLEVFDSNSDIIAATVSNQVNALLNGHVPVVAPPSQVRMNILSYWRLYQPSTQTIIDQYQTSSNITYNLDPINIPLGTSTQLANAAYQAGDEYIQRLLPSYYSVSRQLYKRGKGQAKLEFQAAFRRAEVANWTEAIDIWTNALDHADYTNAGRATLNIAVAYEVLGNTDKALYWAQKSYQDFGNQLARDYAKQLLRRKAIE